MDVLDSNKSRIRRLIGLLTHYNRLNIGSPFSLFTSIQSMSVSLQNLIDAFDYRQSYQLHEVACQTDTHLPDVGEVSTQPAPQESMETEQTDKAGLTESELTNLRQKLGVSIPRSQKAEKMAQDAVQESDDMAMLNSFLKFNPPALSRKDPETAKERVFARKAPFVHRPPSLGSSDSPEYSSVSDYEEGGTLQEEKSGESPMEEEEFELSDSPERAVASNPPRTTAASTGGLLVVPRIPDMNKFGESPVESNSKTKAVCSSSDSLERGECPRPRKRRHKCSRISPTIRRIAQVEEEREERLKRQCQENERIGWPSRQLVLESDPVSGEVVVGVEDMFVSVLMPHQADAVRFMWNVCVERVAKFGSNESVRGCILAHCMGLGKSLSAICLTYTLLACEGLAVRTVLLLCPASTLLNWRDEFERWLPYGSRDFGVHVIAERGGFALGRLEDWGRAGGFCVTTYDLFRAVAGNERYGRLRSADVVVCDEVHTLKNHKSKISRALGGIRTRVRIGMTGTPIQNCLREYHTMIKFVQPALLGSRRHFYDHFVRPIENGQMADSTEHDVRVMKRRVHVLFKILSNTVHRRGFEVLQDLLPRKVEYVLDVRLSPLQTELYSAYLRANTESVSLRQFFCHYLVLRTIWTHPALLRHEGDTAQLGDPDWWRAMVPPDLPDPRHSGKMIVFLEILAQCVAIGDKVLCFSQSLATLDYIEGLLTGGHDPWVRDTDYFRIDGSVPLRKRHEHIADFGSKAKLFLISTKSGSLGVNMNSANRVILLDVSWNPSDDLQSIFRAYRIGQTKCVYVYRLIVPKSMEEVIYGRQISKLSLSSRVIDENQISRHFSNDQLHRIYHFDPRDHQTPADNDVFEFPKDDLLAAVLSSHKVSGWILSYKDHDSFLQNRIDEKLSQEECRAAWDEYYRGQTDLIIRPPPSEHHQRSHPPLSVRPVRPPSEDYHRSHTGLSVRPPSEDYHRSQTAFSVRPVRPPSEDYHRSQTAVTVRPVGPPSGHSGEIPRLVLPSSFNIQNYAHLPPRIMENFYRNLRVAHSRTATNQGPRVFRPRMSNPYDNRPPSPPGK